MRNFLKRHRKTRVRCVTVVGNPDVDGVTKVGHLTRFCANPFLAREATAMTTNPDANPFLSSGPDPWVRSLVQRRPRTCKGRSTDERTNHRLSNDTQSCADPGASRGGGALLSRRTTREATGMAGPRSGGRDARSPREGLPFSRRLPLANGPGAARFDERDRDAGG
jgi:hypothetical protein